MKYTEICDMALCSGCSACANACSHNAITMKPDNAGFLYPHIDKTKCIDCGLCQKTCPNNTPKEEFIFPHTIAFVEKDTKYLTAATSGGAFGVVARFILNEGGRVYGSYMDDAYNVFFTSIDSIEDLWKLHGSKYVQTHVGLIYRDVKADLTEGKHVLFCGCPCQVDGLKNFLRRDYDNLITMDLICHGIPSQKYFRSYVKDLLRRKKKDGITTFHFRYKPEMECENQHKDIISNNVYVGFHNKDYYMTYFLWGKGYRSGCYSCRYAGWKRPADFTIGDFWNNKNCHLLSDVSKGSSLVLFNTPKALQLEYLFKENGTCATIPTLTDAIGSDGGQLKHPSKNDVRTKLIYLLYSLFGVRGPKSLFKFDCFRMGIK